MDTAAVQLAEGRLQAAKVLFERDIRRLKAECLGLEQQVQTYKLGLESATFQCKGMLEPTLYATEEKLQKLKVDMESFKLQINEEQRARAVTQERLQQCMEELQVANAKLDDRLQEGAAIRLRDMEASDVEVADLRRQLQTAVLSGETARGLLQAQLAASVAEVADLRRQLQTAVMSGEAAQGRLMVRLEAANVETVSLNGQLQDRNAAGERLRAQLETSNVEIVGLGSQLQDRDTAVKAAEAAFQRLQELAKCLKAQLLEATDKQMSTEEQLQASRYEVMYTADLLKRTIDGIAPIAARTDARGRGWGSCHAPVPVPQRNPQKRARQVA